MIQETIQDMATTLSELHELVDRAPEYDNIHKITANHSVIANRIGYLTGNFNKMITELTEILPDDVEENVIEGFVMEESGE
jgi:hypothetical protein